jgi:hypothetical protein
MVWIEGQPAEALDEVWAYLSPDEARDLLESLRNWFEEYQDDPGWHTHITSPGRELTIAIGREASEGKIPRDE